MLTNIITLSNQVFVLFILIGLGFILTKKDIITEKSASTLTDLALCFATPCVIIQSFSREFKPEMLSSLLWSFLASLLIFAFSIAFVHLILFRKNDSRSKVEQFGVVFSNAGFMGLPLQQAILGDDGVFFGATYVAVFNLYLWTYGVFVMSGDKKTLSAKKLIINPGIIGVVIGLIIFFFSVKLPSFIAQPVNYIAGLNTPLPMLVIGYHLAKSDVKKALRDLDCYWVVFLRLFVFPLISLFGMWVCGARGTMLVALTIAISAPVAAACTMFSSKFNRDTNLSVNVVSVSTLSSIISMPLIVALAQLIQ